MTNESYAFDAVGNRTSSHLSSSYTYSPFNRLTATQTASYGFNAEGSTVRRSEGKDFWRYTWDFENRMTESANRKERVRYKYDALGRRVSRNAGVKGYTKYTYDGQDAILDNSDGTLTRYQNGPGIDNKLALSTTSGSKYFLQDHLRSTVSLTDTAGTVTDSNSYDSFGNPTTASFPTRFQFTGREFDSTTGLQYSRARFYDPKLGRFISEDPIGFNGGDVNLYGYVRNQPYNYRDSMGLYPGEDVLSDPNIWRWIGAGLGAIGGAIGAAASSPAVVAGGGFAAGYGIGYYPGQWTAESPYNPVVHGPWPLNPFKPPFGYPTVPPFPVPPWTPATVSGPTCQPLPRPIPWFRDRTFPFPSDPPSDRDGCAEEISACVQLCSKANSDPDMSNIWGGSYKACLQGCISERCKKGMKF